MVGYPKIVLRHCGSQEAGFSIKLAQGEADVGLLGRDSIRGNEIGRMPVKKPSAQIHRHALTDAA
jgi:hypothetical protein